MKKVGNVIRIVILSFLGLFLLLAIIGRLMTTPEQREAARQETARAAAERAKRQPEPQRVPAAVSEPAKPQARKETLAERGQSYKIDQTMIGPRDLKDRDELVKAIRYDRQGAIEMIGRNRAAMVNEGETVLVVDRDVSIMNGVWVQVRVTDGLAKGLLWVPQSVLEGFEQ